MKLSTGKIVLKGWSFVESIGQAGMECRPHHVHDSGCRLSISSLVVDSEDFTKTNMAQEKMDRLPKTILNDE